MLLRDAPGNLLGVLVAIIIGREITISALREWMAELGARTSVAVSWIGKWKTGFQMTAIGMMIWKIPTFGLPWYDMGRSEEHTSELQSLMRISYAVFCLKKKKINVDCTYE